MKTLIVYESKYGCTEECANRLAGLLAGEVELANAKKTAPPPPEGYDRVLIGGSVRVGRLHKSLRRYAATHEQVLLQKRLGFFVCCSEPAPAHEKFLKENFSAALLSAAPTASFGGEYRLEKMNPIERKIILMIADKYLGGQQPQVDEGAIEVFSKSV